MKDLAFEKSFLKILSDKFYDELGELVEGQNAFNEALSQFYPDLPPCELFSGGTTSAVDGTTRMFISIDNLSGSEYGVNGSSVIDFRVNLSLMLPSGVFDQVAWQQTIGYKNTLIHVAENALQKSCLLENIALIDWDVDLFTQTSDNMFDVFEGLAKIEKKKLVLTINAKKIILGGNNVL